MVNITKNKRGDIAITILVIGVFALCAFAIISFFISLGKNVNSDFTGPIPLQNVSARLQSFYFYVDSGIPPQQAANNIHATIVKNVNGHIVPDPEGNILNITCSYYPFGVGNYQGFVSVTYLVDIKK